MPGAEGVPGPHKERCALRLVQPPHVGDLVLGDRSRSAAADRYEVVLDEAAVSGEPDRCQQVPLSSGDEDVGRDHGPPRAAVQPGTEHDRGRRRGRAAVAAVGQRREGGSAQAVVANPAVAKERSAGTAQLVVVHSRHDRDSGVAAGVQDRRRYQRKDVVEVDDIGRELDQRLGDRPPGILAPQDADRQSGTPQRRPVRRFPRCAAGKARPRARATMSAADS